MTTPRLLEALAWSWGIALFVGGLGLLFRYCSGDFRRVKTE